MAFIFGNDGSIFNKIGSFITKTKDGVTITSNFLDGIIYKDNGETVRMIDESVLGQTKNFNKSNGTWICDTDGKTYKRLDNRLICSDGRCWYNVETEEEAESILGME